MRPLRFVLACGALAAAFGACSPTQRTIAAGGGAPDGGPHASASRSGSTTTSSTSSGAAGNGGGSATSVTSSMSSSSGVGGFAGAGGASPASSSTGGAGVGGSGAGGSIPDAGMACKPPACGGGLAVACTIAAECPTPASACLKAVCQAGCCATANVASGTACSDSGGTVCNGSGKCTEPSCTDAKQDGSETDVDCGGGVCPPCANGQKCASGADCADKVCSPVDGGSVCAASSCSDGIKNGNETGVDCGGSCKGCTINGPCRVGSDCVQRVCTPKGTCAAPTCNDCEKNGNETGVDCGGGTCAVCPLGQGCGDAGDCASGHCAQSTCCENDCNTDNCYACNIGPYWKGQCIPVFLGDQGSCMGGGVLGNGQACGDAGVCVTGAANGQQCFNNNCVSGKCSNGVFGICEHDQPDGGICATNADCQSGSCDPTAHVCR